MNQIFGNQGLGIIFPVLAIIIAVILIALVIKAMWKIVDPGMAGVVTGFKKQRVIVGQGGLVVPVFEKMQYIPLGNINLDVTSSGILSSQSVPITVKTTAIIKVKNETTSILTAMEQFNGGNPRAIIQEVEEQATAVLEGQLRTIVAGLTVEKLYNDRDTFASEVEKVVGTEFSKMGLEVKSFTIKDVSDENGYIQSMGEGRIAEQKKDAEIRKANALREQTIQTTEAIKLGEQARIENKTAVQESEKNQAVKSSAYKEEEQRALAKAEIAKEIQNSISQQEVITANAEAELLREQKNKDIMEARIQVNITEAQKNTELAEQKAKEKEQSLRSEIIEPAKADRLRQAEEAEADKYNSIKKAEAEAERKKIDAKAEAEAILARAKAEADAITAKADAEANAISKKGSAEADATEAKLLAEARGLKAKAEALQQMNDAGKMQMVIEQLPNMAREIAAPLGKIGKISIISSGSGEEGVKEIGGYVPSVMAKTFQAIEETTGFDMTDILRSKTIQAVTDKHVIVDTDKSAEEDLNKNHVKKEVVGSVAGN